MKQKSIIFLLIASFAMLYGSVAFADGGFLEPCTGGNACNTGLICQDGKICVYQGGQSPQGISDVYLIVDNIVNWVFVFVMLLSVVFVILAGFQFVTGGPEGAKEARERLMWAAIGIGVAILARAFPNVIRMLIS
ncbi:MAG: pilin [bacterium]|nr:pilin [bacterium]